MLRMRVNPRAAASLRMFSGKNGRAPITNTRIHVAHYHNRYNATMSVAHYHSRRNATNY